MSKINFFLKTAAKTGKLNNGFGKRKPDMPLVTCGNFQKKAVIGGNLSRGVGGGENIDQEIVQDMDFNP